MSFPFEFRDYCKRYKDLSTNNFPSLNKKKELDSNIKFKFSSKDKGVKIDTSFDNKNRETTESEFSAKVNLEELKGVEFGLKAKNKPSTELTLRFSDDLIPLKGSSFTLKSVATSPGEQTLGGIFGFKNNLVNLNFGLSFPLKNKFFPFVTSEEDLNKQRTKIDLDFVVQPLENKNYFVGSQVNAELARDENDQFLYKSQVFVGMNCSQNNTGLTLTHNKEFENNEFKHSTSFGAWFFTEKDSLSGGGKVQYTPSKSEENGKGFEFEIIGGLQRDKDSKLSSKLTVVPNPTISLGYEQKFSPNTKLSFGYAFLFNNSNSSAYTFGVDFSL